MKTAAGFPHRPATASPSSQAPPGPAQSKLLSPVIVFHPSSSPTPQWQSRNVRFDDEMVVPAAGSYSDEVSSAAGFK
ncbi:hypothetical protein CSOJ01_13479 [Colletotrichum sojae]|uniref:Uncharacterized protein n=1 Tax=Colletotrichum sojae TaxID=2175907 RepID=A0A8H6IT49_9PEZI|nr:hypothetical protein CSOJ01_13479 [Colletotrichum sojae]